MQSSPWTCIAALGAAALALYLLCIRFDPKKPHARWLRHGVMGVLMLTLWNALPLPHLGMNPLSVMATGALGLPGMGLMAVINTIRPVP